MRRKPIVIGNWKMNIDHVRAADWLHAYANIDGLYPVDAAVLPSFTSLYTISSLARRMGLTSLSFGAQTVSDVHEGAFTGDISASMLETLDCRYVLIGHSEQRRNHPEDDDKISDKVRAVLRHHMTPIICIGESMSERKNSRGIEYPLSQLADALYGLTRDDMEHIVIAYEPIFAIGSGVALSDYKIESALHDIRLFISAVYGDDASENIRILYGGSVNPTNAEQLVRLHDLDGFLVGGASLDPYEFIDIMRSVSSISPYKMHGADAKSWHELRDIPYDRREVDAIMDELDANGVLRTSLALIAYRTVGFGTMMSMADDYAISAADSAGVPLPNTENALRDMIAACGRLLLAMFIDGIREHQYVDIISLKYWMLLNNHTMPHDDRCGALLNEYESYACHHAYDQYHGTMSYRDFSGIFRMGYLACDHDANNRHWRKRGIDR